MLTTQKWLYHWPIHMAVRETNWLGYFKPLGVMKAKVYTLEKEH
jgi:hypothetical protein